MNSIKIDQLTIEVPGGSVYVKTWTPETASSQSPLILLHDSLGCVDLWRDLPAVLAKKLSRTVIAYDRLGFGKSDARHEPPSLEFIEEEATTYFPVIKQHLSFKHYCIFGYSVGGSMAINIASRDPDCNAVVTLSAQAFVEDITISGIKDAQELFRQPAQLNRLEKWHGNKAQWILRAWFDVWLSPDFSGWNLRSALSKVQCPVLAIHGEQDQFGSAAFPQFIANNSAGPASMLLLEDCGHTPLKEQPEKVINAVNRFLVNVS